MHECKLYCNSLIPTNNNRNTGSINFKIISQVHTIQCHVCQFLMHNTDAHRNPHKTCPSTTPSYRPPPIQESEGDDEPTYAIPVVGLQSSLQVKNLPVYYNINASNSGPQFPKCPPLAPPSGAKTNSSYNNISATTKETCL